MTDFTEFVKFLTAMVSLLTALVGLSKALKHARVTPRHPRSRMMRATRLRDVRAPMRRSLRNADRKSVV